MAGLGQAFGLRHSKSLPLASRWGRLEQGHPAHPGPPCPFGVGWAGPRARWPKLAAFGMFFGPRGAFEIPGREANFRGGPAWPRHFGADLESNDSPHVPDCLFFRSGLGQLNAGIQFRVGNRPKHGAGVSLRVACSGRCCPGCRSKLPLMWRPLGAIKPVLSATPICRPSSLCRSLQCRSANSSGNACVQEAADY